MAELIISLEFNRLSTNVFNSDRFKFFSFVPLPDMPVLGSSNSAANKYVMQKYGHGDTFI